MVQRIVFLCVYYIQIFDRLTHHLFIKIHTQLHVPAMLSQPQCVSKLYKNIM
jgi:hypothetical protein